MAAIGDSDEIQWESAGRRAPHTGIQDWVALSGVSPEAIGLYVLIRIHENADLDAHTATLAAMMGFSRPDKIRRFAKELEDIGAITTRRMGLPSRNVYRTVPEPPESYEGPRTVAQWVRTGPVVYYVQRTSAKSGPAIKIGYTASLPERLKALAREHGEVTLLGVEPGSPAREMELHHRFHDARLFGEWFSPEPDLLAHIEAVQA